MPDLTGVEIARTGTYMLSQGGERTFGKDDLAAAVAHAADGHTPRIKLGHVDPRFDGEPALGRVTNLRIDEDGDVLLGDLVGMPDWLAEAAPTAYPGRSIEASTTGPGDLRISGLALLGMTAPAIGDLRDLQHAIAASEGGEVQLFAAVDAAGKPLTVLVERELRAAGPAIHTPAQGVRDAAAKGLDLVKAGRGGMGLTEGAKARARSIADGEAQTLAQARRMAAYFTRHADDRKDGWDTAGEETPGYVAWQLWGGDAGRSWAKGIVDDAEQDLQASGINLDQLHEAYRESLQNPDGVFGPYVQDVFVDPNELIVRDGTQLWRVTWAWDEQADTFTFGEHQEVRVEYVDVAASAPTTLHIKPDSRRPDTPKEGPMTPKELRAALSLPEDATDQQVTDTIAASVAGAEQAKAVRGKLGLGDDVETSDVTAKLGEAVAASAPTGTVVVDKTKYEELTASAALGRKAHEQLVQRDDERARDEYLRGKVLDGTLPQASVGDNTWTHQLWASAGPDQTKATIDAMPADTVPVLDRVEVDLDDAIAASAGGVQLPEDGSVPEGMSLLTPDERAQRAS